MALSRALSRRNLSPLLLLGCAAAASLAQGCAPGPADRLEGGDATSRATGVDDATAARDPDPARVADESPIAPAARRLARDLRSALPAAQTGTLYFVSPEGKTSQPGSKEAPWDLATALSGANGMVKPGDTVWVRGGTYDGNFVASVKGTEANPIVLRAYPGERAVLRAASGSILRVTGDHVWVWGLEVSGTSTVRQTDTSGSFAGIAMPNGISLAAGTGNKLINNIVHDTTGSIGDFWESSNTEGSGNILYYCGWQGPDRGHGHDIYVQNLGNLSEIDAFARGPSIENRAKIATIRERVPTSKKLYRQNISFDAFDMGLHAYTEKGWVDDIQFVANVAFNAGKLSTGGATKNIWQSTALRPILKDNFTYGGTGVTFAGGSRGGVATGNFLTSGSAPTCATDCTSANNILFTVASPRANKISVLRDPHEMGRAIIVVYNWEGLPKVNVSLPDELGYGAGDRFEIRDAQNYFRGAKSDSDVGAPILGPSVYAAGTQLEIPMSGLTAATPVGWPAPAHTAPEFGVFVVVPVLDL